MWLLNRLTPDFKTIAHFHKDHGAAIRNVCSELVVLCQRLNLFSEAVVAIDGNKFKAFNNQGKNFTDRKLKTRSSNWKTASHDISPSLTGLIAILC